VPRRRDPAIKSVWDNCQKHGWAEFRIYPDRTGKRNGTPRKSCVLCNNEGSVTARTRRARRAEMGPGGGWTVLSWD
jgi:hypothetical protein